MKITIKSMTTGPDILAIFQNADHTVTIKVLADTSYEITRNGVTTKTDMTKWYYNGYGVIKHIENDIQAGYYSGVRRIA
jgi:hypothetical protein